MYRIYKSYKCKNCGFHEITEEELWECPKCFSTLESYEISSDSIERIKKFSSQYFSYRDLKITETGFHFIIDSLFYDFETIKKAFGEVGYLPFLSEKEGLKYIKLMPKPPKGKDNYPLHLGLLIATFATTTMAGYLISQPLVEDGYMTNIWFGALSFSFGLMLILGSHELGHKFAALKSGVDATWPYFIPIPPIIFMLGTLGAVIRVRSPLPNRDSAIRMGVSGPLVGVLFSIPVLFLGLRLSYPVETIEPLHGVLQFGEPLLFRIVERFATQIPENHDLFLHPLAFAGWVGLFVTSLNLIPIGQLDGGHILRSFLGEGRYERTSNKIVGVLIIMGLLGYLRELNPAFSFLPSFWPGWLLWGLIIFLFIGRIKHPGSMNELEKISSFGKFLALMALIIFILCFIPEPLKFIP